MRDFLTNGKRLNNDYIFIVLFIPMTTSVWVSQESRYEKCIGGLIIVSHE
jgi:hypothetical protein